ncbi:hypothetical protein ILUMI_04407 [Ignelater luminosus]|uniref:Cytochrome P450 n=1 Tax=Ignelater luminosus TaxID=2038154 RepID=A0A8K0D971_IGNLU|nr:hypothetical protein ILUMI_04407 [Ignelater luminosus]
MYTFLFLSLAIISVAYLFFKKKHDYWKLRGVPYPRPSLIFGNVGEAIMLRARLSDLLHKVYNEYRGYYYVGLFNFWNPAVVIRNPEIIKDVLIKQFGNFHNNWIDVELNIDPIIGFNPFVLNDGLWKTIRTQLTPQLTSSKIKSMFPLINKGCKNMVEYIKKKTDDNETQGIELKDLSARFTGDNVISCAYGLDGNSFNVKTPDSFKIGEHISSQSKLVQLKQTIALFLPLLRKIFKTTFLGDPVPKMFSDIVLETIKYREENNIERNDYLGYLKELKTKTSPIETTNDMVVAHAFTFFLDGFETSSLTLAYGLLELALHPDIQRKAQKEIQTILEKHNNALTYEAVQEMEYVDNILSETLRKHPIILFLSRICTDNHTFPPPQGPGTGKDVVIEKGTHIFIPVYSVHNDSDYYPNPELFDPDRFTEDARNSRPKCCFLGFGDGPRICLGRKFAIAQVKLGLISILSNFDLKVNKKTCLPVEYENVHVFNSPKTDIWLDFCKRL